MINLIYPFPGLSPEVFITPEYDLLVGSTFSCIFEDNRQVRSIRACSPPRLPVLQRQHVAKAYAGAADAGAAGNSAATNQPPRLMQPLPSSSVYSVPLLRWSPGGVLLEQLLPRLLECLQRAAVVCCAGRELLPGRLAAGSSGFCNQLDHLVRWCQ